jgi:putative endonuclease
MWFVYLIQTENNKLYCGITTDVERRFEEHKNNPKGAKFTKANKPKKVVYVEECKDRSTASKREYEIKRMTKKEKETLVSFYRLKK